MTDMVKQFGAAAAGLNNAGNAVAMNRAAAEMANRPTVKVADWLAKFGVQVGK